MFEEIIKILLEKKANLITDKEAEKNIILSELDAKYAEREEQIAKLLDDAGYVEPVEEVSADEEVTEATEEVNNETAEENWR